jgi:hypothetical protein
MNEKWTCTNCGRPATRAISVTTSPQHRLAVAWQRPGTTPNPSCDYTGA